MEQLCALDTTNIGYTVALVTGGLALMVMLLWPSQKHCTCCSKKVAKSDNRRHK